MKTTIFLEKAKFQGFLGVNPKEKKRTQEILIDLRLEFDSCKAISSEKLEDTISYSDVYNLIEKIVSSKKFSLIESLGNEILLKLFQEFSLAKKVGLRISKPEVLNGRVKAVGVEFYKEK